MLPIDQQPPRQRGSLAVAPGSVLDEHFISKEEVEAYLIRSEHLEPLCYQVANALSLSLGSELQEKCVEDKQSLCGPWDLLYQATSRWKQIGRAQDS